MVHDTKSAQHAQNEEEQNIYIYSDVMGAIQCTYPPHHHCWLVLTLAMRELCQWTADDDYRQVHAHTHFRRPMAPHKVITSLHQRPVKQALHHTNI